MGNGIKNIEEAENELLQGLAPLSISVLKAKGIKNPEAVWQRMSDSINLGGAAKEQAKTAINALMTYSSMPGMYQSQFPLDAFNPLKSAHYDFQNRKQDNGFISDTGNNLATVWNKGVIDFVQGLARIPQLFDTVTDKGAAFLGKLNGQTTAENQAINNNSLAGIATNKLAAGGNNIADWLEHHAQFKTDDLYEQTKQALLPDGSLNPNLSFLNTAIDGIASFVPTLAAALYTDGAAAYPRLTTFLTSFTSTLDSYTRDLEKSGANKDTATLLGMTKAIIEGGFESLLGPEADIVSAVGSIEKNMGKLAFKDALKSLTKEELSPAHFLDAIKISTKDKLKQIPLSILKEGAQEATGEMLTELTTQAVNQIYDYLSPLDHERFGDNILSKKTFIDVVNAGVAGAIGGMAMTGVHSGYELKKDTYEPTLFNYINSKINLGANKNSIIGEFNSVADKNRSESGVSNKQVMLDNIGKLYDAAEQINAINPNIQDSMARYQIYDLSEKQKQLQSEITDYTGKLGEIENQMNSLSSDNTIARNALLTSKYGLEKDAPTIDIKQKQLALIDDTFKNIGTTLKFDDTFKSKFEALANPTVSDNTASKENTVTIPSAKDAGEKIGSDLLSGNINLENVTNNTTSTDETPQINTSSNEKITTLRKGVPKEKQQLKGAMLEATRIETNSARDEVLKAFIGGAKLTRDALFDFFEKGKRQENKNSTEILSRIGITNNKNGYSTLDEFAHALWENSELNRYDEKYTSQDFRNAIEDVLLSHISTATMAKEILDFYKTLNEVEQQQFAEQENEDKIDSEFVQNYEEHSIYETPKEDLEYLNEVELSEDESKTYEDYLKKFTNENGEVDWDKVAENSNDFFNDLFLNLPSNVQQKVFQDEKQNTNQHKQSDTGTESKTRLEDNVHAVSDKQTETGKTNQAEREQRARQALKDAQAEVAKLGEQYNNLQEKLANNFQEQQTDLFGANRTQSLFDDKAEQQKLVDDKKAQLETAKSDLKKAKQDLERIKDEKDQIGLFDNPTDTTSDYPNDQFIQAANRLLEMLNEGLKPKEQYQFGNTVPLQIQSNKFYILEAVHPNERPVYNILDEHGNPPPDTSVNWRISSLIQSDIKDLQTIKLNDYLFTPQQILKSSVADINNNYFDVHQNTVTIRAEQLEKQLEPLQQALKGKRGEEKKNIEVQLDEIKQQIKTLENSFFLLMEKYNDGIKKMIADYANIYQLTLDDEQIENYANDFVLSVFERPGVEHYWKYTGQQVLDDIFSDVIETPDNTTDSVINDKNNTEQTASNTASKDTTSATKKSAAKKKRKQRISVMDDELAGLWDDFAAAINAIKKLSDDEKEAKIFSIGIKLAKVYTEKGIYKLYDMVSEMADHFGDEIANQYLPYLKRAYNMLRGDAEKKDRHLFDTEDEVSDFKIEDIYEDVETTKQTDSSISSFGTIKDALGSKIIIAKVDNTLEKSENNNEITNENKDDGTNDRPAVSELSEQSSQNENTSSKQFGTIPKRKSESDVQGTKSERGTGRFSDTKTEHISSGRGVVQVDELSTEWSRGISERGLISIVEPTLQNFTIDEPTQRETFNPKKRFDDNLTALQTLVTLLKEKRDATLQEQQLLSKYVGWGGLKVVLLGSGDKWTASDEQHREQVSQLNDITKQLEQFGLKNIKQNIKSSTANAHYTAIPIIKSIYTAITGFGFTGGKILEPSAGIGNFLGVMPKSLREKSQLSAVELDTLTGEILKRLYPNSNTYITGLEDAGLPNNYYDLIISNVPFGKYPVFDKTFTNPTLKKATQRIHNYFFAKAIQQAKEGGLIAFVTSAGLMDSGGNKFLRQYISEQTEFLGAIRLPNTTFVDNANTQVVTDVIFLKKKTGNVQQQHSFIETGKLTVPHKDTGADKLIDVNEYYINNPSHVIGEFKAGGLYNDREMTLVAEKGTNIAEAMNAIITDNFPKNIYQKITENKNISDSNTDNNDEISTIPDGELYISKDNKAYKKIGFDTIKEVAQTHSVSKVKDFISLRDALKKQYELESENNTDETIEENRKLLNKSYHYFIGKYGTLNSTKNTALIGQDINGFNILSLENIDKQSKQTIKSDIFNKRVIQSKQYVSSADNIQDAINISINEVGFVNIDRIASLLNSDKQSVIENNYGTLYLDSNGNAVTRDDYLSGNVKQKLSEAIELAKTNPIYQQNVKDLEGVIPEDIPAINIDVNIGARWIDTSYYADFVNELLNTNSTVTYLASNDSYTVNGNSTVESRDKYGTSRINAFKLIEQAMQGQSPIIRDKVSSNPDKYVTNKTETSKASEKQNEIIDAFSNWIWKDAGRREKLGTIYNAKFNTTVKRKYDGTHLSFEGLNGVELRQHQKDAVAMLIHNNGGIIDHIVGAGKTYVMITGAMKLKQLGIVNKPAIIGLKSTIPDLVMDAKKACPTAKILTPTESDFSAKNRKRFLSKIQNNDWDLIIMSHEQFSSIPQDSEMMLDVMNEQLDQLDEEIENIRAEGGEVSKHMLKGLEIRRQNLNTQIKDLLNAPKDAEIVNFKQIGIDHLLVDESQMFKNLEYVTRINRVAGLGNQKGSKRSFNLLNGIRTIQRLQGGDKGVTFLSGTPISNSLVEMYLLFKYLRPTKMASLGYNTFDAWVKQFAVQSSELEFAVTGSVKQNTRFREFINVPELGMLYNEIADIRNDDNLKLPKPKIKTGSAQLILVKQSPYQQEWTKRLIEFAKQEHGQRDGELIGKGRLTEAQQSAAMLMVTNLSNKLSIDMRLINRNAEDNPTGKLSAVADKVAEEYFNSGDIKGTQLIFCDTGTPKSGNAVEDVRGYLEDELNINTDDITAIFGDENARLPSITQLREKLANVLEYDEGKIDNIIAEAKAATGQFNVYDEIKRKLIAKGIPANEIVFIHDYKTKLSKEKLFIQVNDGTVRIVLGSTQKLGTGVNVQRRIVALHHIDAQWNPAAMEQRNGRGIRQKNLNQEVAIYNYGTELTLDAYKYQLIATKQKFIDQVKNGALDGERSIKEGDGEDMGSQSFVAQLSGNPLLLEKAKVDNILDRLKKSKRNHDADVYDAISKRDKILVNIPNIEKEIESRKADINTLKTNGTVEDGKIKTHANINGVTPEGAKHLGELINEQKKVLQKKPIGYFQSIGKINGLDLVATVVADTDFAGRQTGIEINLHLKGMLSYKTTSTVDNTAQGTQIGNTLNKLEAQLNDRKEDLEKSKTNAIKYNEISEKVWEKRAEYESAIAKQKDINNQLNEQANEEEKKRAADDTERDVTGIDTNFDDDTEWSAEDENTRYQRELERIDTAITGAQNLAAILERQLTESTQKRSDESSKNRQDNSTTQTQPISAFDKLQSTKNSTDKVRLTPKQTDVIHKILSKVFPNIQMFSSTEEYRSALRSINKSEISSTPTGFIHHGKMYVNPSKVNSSTQMHEMVHLLTSWSVRYAPDIYQKIIQSGKTAPPSIKSYVQSFYPELSVNNDAFHEEVFVTFAGKQLSKSIENLLQREENKTWYDKIITHLQTLFRQVINRARIALGMDITDLKPSDFMDMNITEFAHYLGERMLSGKKLSDITSDEVSEIEQIRNSKSESAMSADRQERVLQDDINRDISHLTANEKISFDKATKLLKKGTLLKDIYKRTGWRINFNTGNWEYSSASNFRFQKDSDIDSSTLLENISTPKPSQKTAVDVAFLNNKKTLEDLQTVIVSKNANNLSSALADIRNIFDPYIDVLTTAKTVRGNPFISQGILDAYHDDAKLSEVVMMMLDKTYETSDSIVPYLYDSLFTTTKGSILNQYKNWIEANNYTTLDIDETGDIHQQLTEYDDKTDRQNIIEEKNKLANNKSGFMAKLFNLSVNGKKLGSLLPKHFLFRSIWNEKTIASMFGKKGDAFYEVLSSAVDNARSIAMPYRTVAIHTENALIDKYKSLSVYGNHSNFNAVKKMSITSIDGNTYDITYGQAISILGTAETQIADKYKRGDGELGISILDSKVKIENYKGNNDIEFTLDYNEYERIRETIFEDSEAKALFNELMEYYNRADFKDIFDNTDTTKKSLFATISKIFMIDNAMNLELSNRYYPLQSYNVPIPQSTSAVAAESQLADDVSVLHNRTKVVSPLIIKDAIEALHDFNNKSINFIEYWLPTRNINTFVNRNEQWMRNNGLEYIVENLREYAKNLNNFDKLEYEANKAAYVKPIKSLVSAFAVSRLSFNLFTALKQFWGYPIGFGLGIIDNKYLQSELGNTAKEMGVSYGALVREFQNYVAGKKVSNLVDIQPYIDEIAKNRYAYDVLYRLTNANLYNMNDIISQSVGVNNYTDSKGALYWNKFINFFKEVGFAQIKQADAAVVIGLYKAAQAQVNDTMPNADEDIQQKEIARLTTEIMYATQQTNVLSDKTQVQLSHHIIDRTMSIFSAQTQKMINTVAQLYISYAKEIDPAKKEELGKQFTWSLNTMYIGNAMYMAFITSLAGLIRGGKGDDDKELTERFKWNFLRELANAIPGYTGQLASSVVTNFDDAKWADDVGGLDPFQPVNSMLHGLYSTVQSTYTDKSSTERNKLLHDGMERAIKGIGDVTGVSQELIRMLKTLNP